MKHNGAGWWCTMQVNGAQSSFVPLKWRKSRHGYEAPSALWSQNFWGLSFGFGLSFVTSRSESCQTTGLRLHGFKRAKLRLQLQLRDPVKGLALVHLCTHVSAQRTFHKPRQTARQTDRRRYIRDHHALAEVGSKLGGTSLPQWVIYIFNKFNRLKIL